ncbi:MAG: DnaJ domain-containing protein [bacterium]|nr:DnaJ domain-containing protein [bacterium]
MNDPYETLGVGKDASDAEIDAAYRKKARKKHPDHGGDPAEFRMICAARELLKDPARRGQYDEYGVDADDPEKEAMGVIEQMIGNAFLQDRIDPLKMIRRDINQGIVQIRLARSEKEKRKRQYSLQIKKFTERNPEGGKAVGFIEAKLRGLVDGLERGIKSDDRNIEVGELALNLLKDVKGTWDLESALGRMTNGPDYMTETVWRTTAS